MTPSILATCWTTAGDAAPLDGRRLSPLPLGARIAAAARAGFSGFGIGYDDLCAHLRAATLRDLRVELSDHGMETVELEFLSDWWTDGERRIESDSRLEFLRRCADGLAASHVKIGADEANDDFDLDRWAEQFARVCDAFAEVGTAVALEFTAFSNVPTLSRAHELVDAAGHDNGGLLLDIWHLERGGYAVDELAALPVGYVKGVELDDGATAPASDPYLDTVNNRRLPGMGEFAVETFARTLAGIGWAGPWGVEILSAQHRHRDLAESLPDVFAATVAVLTQAGIC